MHIYQDQILDQSWEYWEVKPLKCCYSCPPSQDPGSTPALPPPPRLLQARAHWPCTRAVPSPPYPRSYPRSSPSPQASPVAGKSPSSSGTSSRPAIKVETRNNDIICLSLLEHLNRVHISMREYSEEPEQRRVRASSPGAAGGPWLRTLPP